MARPASSAGARRPRTWWRSMSTDATPTDASDAPAPSGPQASEAPWGIVGHDHAVGALRRAVEAGRLAHAYLFTGPPGAGKGALATRLAQALSCDTPAEDSAPCLVCRSCRQVEAGESPDIERIRIGGVCDESGHPDHSGDRSTRIRICQVRRVERVASLAPFRSRRRIFVIDTADDLQTEAAHALLKTLEEPPPTVLLLMLATDGDALLPTIRSRCQEIALRPMPAPALEAALVAHAGIAEHEARELSALAQGRYGLAMRMHADPSLRVLRETAAEEMARLVLADRNERFDAAETLAQRWTRERDSVLATLDTWRGWWRDVLQVTAGLEGGVISESARAASEACAPRDAVLALQAIQRAREHLLANTNAQLVLEVLMLDLPVLAGKEARGLATPAG
ncbi:MAG: NACHT domain-containing protein [Dehalococcoidia bacterium]|nr:NACHT domain-containing protein [Dehalococcoidia bacterium]